MSSPPKHPPLKTLHPDSSLIASKLANMESADTDILEMSLLPGRKGCLKTRDDGTILDGQHRIYILRKRGVDDDALPREVIERNG